MVRCELFSDRIDKIVFHAGLVHIVFVSDSAKFMRRNSESSGFEVVMNPLAFLQTFNAMSDLTDRLIKAGICEPDKSASGNTADDSAPDNHSKTKKSNRDKNADEAKKIKKIRKISQKKQNSRKEKTY